MHVARHRDWVVGINVDLVPIGSIWHRAVDADRRTLRGQVNGVARVFWTFPDSGAYYLDLEILAGTSRLDGNCGENVQRPDR